MSRRNQNWFFNDLITAVEGVFDAQGILGNTLEMRGGSATASVAIPLTEATRNCGRYFDDARAALYCNGVGADEALP